MNVKHVDDVNLCLIQLYHGSISRGLRRYFDDGANVGNKVPGDFVDFHICMVAFRSIWAVTLDMEAFSFSEKAAVCLTM